ncbi:hypothetical protein AVEN_82520-1 [Araneus ventricosus]|uniref:Uncharacterized protein n=1 Tax=Araneus ventricosus TaxID=182803 RepID=A0A4Y2K502_ARAVE|nr:hypothetical protein AVEN_82520-1 [Araneus ventricosus]
MVFCENGVGKDGRTVVFDEGGQERKSIACEGPVQRVDQVVREKERRMWLSPSSRAEDSTRVKLNDSRCNNSSTEAGVLAAITGHGPTPPEGGTYYRWRRDSRRPQYCSHV